MNMDISAESLNDEFGVVQPGNKELQELLGKPIVRFEGEQAVGRMRKYLPTLSDLVDRLTITQMKAVFIPEHKKAYLDEMHLIMHDIDMILDEGRPLNAAALRAIMVIMLTNRFIWESESKARAGGNEQDKLLKLTHSINGVRNTAKNKLAELMGGRKDYKIDCFAESLVKDFGDWNVFSE